MARLNGIDEDCSPFCQDCRKILVPYRQVRRRRASAWTQVLPAGALAIGGFVRSRWRGGRGGSYGFCMRDSRFVRRRVGLGGRVKDVGESVSRSEEAIR